MADVYSIRLFRQPAFSGGPTVVFTAPAGFVTVVNTITVVHGDITVSGLDAWVQSDDLTKLVRATVSITDAVGDLGGTDVFEGRWVMYEGETLACQTAAGTVDYYCSGYGLSLP
jgi:hypothetical protein